MTRLEFSLLAELRYWRFLWSFHAMNGSSQFNSEADRLLEKKPHGCVLQLGNLRLKQL